MWRAGGWRVGRTVRTAEISLLQTRRGSETLVEERSWEPSMKFCEERRDAPRAEFPERENVFNQAQLATIISRAGTSMTSNRQLPTAVWRLAHWLGSRSSDDQGLGLAGCRRTSMTVLLWCFMG